MLEQGTHDDRGKIGKHRLEYFRAYAGLGCGLLGYGTADVLRTEHMAEDVIAVANRILVAENVGVFKIAGMLPAIERLEKAPEIHRRLGVAFQPCREGGKQMLQRVHALLLAQPELPTQIGHRLSTLGTRDHVE